MISDKNEPILAQYFGLGEEPRNIIFKSYQRKIAKNHKTNQKS